MRKKIIQVWKLLLLITFLIETVSCEKQDFCTDVFIDEEIVEIDDAKTIAENLVFPDASNLKAAKEKKQIREINTISNNGVPYFYIINFSQDKGFIIISADKRSMPILAFSGRGYIDLQNLPGGLEKWIEESKFYIESMKADTSKQIPFNKFLWSEIDKLILPPIDDPPEDDPEYPPESITTIKGPLLTSIWDQGCGFNAQCPDAWDGPCGKAYAGCPTIALAQIMNYHEYPLSYDWDAMPDDT